MKKLAVFDLDGTLLNTIDDIMNALNYTLKLYGYATCTKEQTLSYVGSGLRVLLERAIGGIVPDNFNDMYLSMTEYYFAHLAVQTKPYEGIYEMLQDLKKEGYYLAVLSNKLHEATCFLIDKFFANIFGMVLGQRNGVLKKPAPDGLYEIMNKFEVSNDETIYIGDSEVDYDTAKNAGVDCILVSYGFRQKNRLELLPDAIILDDSADLYNKLLLMNK